MILTFTNVVPISRYINYIVFTSSNHLLDIQEIEIHRLEKVLTTECEQHKKELDTCRQNITVGI
jgi:hypothetical protein